MADTMDALADHFARRGPVRFAVWAHNSHLGDARATELGGREWNLGQLVRERHPGESFHLGFTTSRGTVTAANEWGEDPATMAVRPAREDSYEGLFHESGAGRFWIDLRDPDAAFLREPRLERAIGVVYRPRSERLSHYFEARLADQFDAVVHVDESEALPPLATAGSD